MKREELIKKGCLVPENVMDAFEMYEEKDVTGTDEALTAYMQKLIKENGAENIYFDFYYGTLLEDEKQKIREKLTSDEVAVLNQKNFSKSREDVYFAYDADLFNIALKLSLNSDLFSTFYFAHTKETVWTNYEKQFLVFRERA